MTWELLLLLISGLVSGIKGGYCKSYQKPVIQICNDGTVSGPSVSIENRETPMEEAVNCTCDVDIGGGTVNSVQYSGPGYLSCGIQFILGENIPLLICYTNTLSNPSPFSVIYFSKMVLATGYACLTITTQGSVNMTITCHGPPTTTPSTTTRQTSTTTSPSKTTPSTTGETTLTSHKTVTTMSSVSTQHTTLSTSTLTESHSTPTSKRQNNSTSTEGTPNSNEGLSKTTLIGIAAGGGGVLLITLVIVVVCCIRKRKGATESDIVITENEVYGSNLSQNNSRLSSPPYTNQSYEIQTEYIPNTVTKTDDHKEPLGGQYTKPDFSDGSAYSEIGELSTVNDRVKDVVDDDQRASDDISSMYSVIHKHKHNQNEDDTVADEHHVTTTSRVKAHETGYFYAVVLKPGKHQN